MSRNMSRNRDSTLPRRQSRSCHQPYHAISETYSKEVTTRPLGPVEDFPPEVVNILKDGERSQTSPVLRSRENNWTNENFPIVRVPSAQFTDILTELYDYKEVEKYTRRSVSPSVRSQAPRYQVIPPTPEKSTPRPKTEGIPLSEAKKPLPMYEEYVKNVKTDENRNPTVIPGAHDPANLNNLRHIDSSSSESSKIASEDVANQRFVYSHDVFVDSSTGRPYTPGRADLEEKKNVGKLKINVYFKPPHPPIEPTYTLDEIEIEKLDDISRQSKLRPSRSATILSLRDPSQPEAVRTEYSDDKMTGRRLPIQTTLLRKENEVMTIPFRRHGEQLRSSSRTIPIHVDDGFPRIPRHPDHQQHRRDQSVEKKSDHDHDYPRQRYPSSTIQSKERSPIVQSVSSSRAADVIDRRSTQRQSPEELDYGKYGRENPLEVLPFSRGISKTPSTYNPEQKSTRSSFKSSATLPAYPEDRSPAAPITRQPGSRRENSYRNPQPDPLRSSFVVRPDVQELPYTRGISKTPSIPSRDDRNSSKGAPVHIPYNQERTQPTVTRSPPVPQKPQRARSPSVKSRHSSAPTSRPATQQPYEEVVHIKERYERDETIRRFFPTTTSV